MTAPVRSAVANMNVKPVRLQLLRRRGFDIAALSHSTNGLPWRVVTRATALGNPFVVGIDGSRDDCCLFYAHLLSGRLNLSSKATVEAQQRCLDATLASLPTLKGHNIACTCRFDGKPCHGGILLLRANLTHDEYCRQGLQEPAKLLSAAANPNILVEIANA